MVLDVLPSPPTLALLPQAHIYEASFHSCPPSYFIPRCEPCNKQSSKTQTKPNQKETKKHYQKSQTNKQKQNKNIQCTHVEERSAPPLNQSIKCIGSFRGLTFPLRRSIPYYSCSRNHLLMSCLQKKYSLPPLSRKERQQRHG